MRISQLQNSSSIGLPVSSCIYTVTTVHPNNQDVAVISSDDSLRIVDPSSSQLMVKTAIGKTHEGVTCLRSVDGAVVTAGRDAKIRIWDPKTGNLSTELNCPNLHGSPPKDTQGEANAPILSLACSNGKIAAGTQLAQSQATISVWDSRYPKEPFVSYTESHSDDVTELQFHPTHSSWLISGSTDGLVNIFDVSIREEEDALLQVVNHGSSIHHAGFLSNDALYALSHDEILSVYRFDPSSTDNESMTLRAFGDLRSRLECDYIVEIVTSSDGTAVLGASSHTKQTLDLVPLHFDSEWELNQILPIRLPGAHGEDIVRSMCYGESDRTIFTGGEDGLFKAWDIGEADGAIKPESSESQADKRPKTKINPHPAKQRFKPY